MTRKLVIVFAGLCSICVLLCFSGYLYWRSLRETPQYSLALLIDASSNDNDREVTELIDTDAIVDDFLPQITAKAVELYGRGLPGETLERVSSVAAPLMPAVKQRARTEIPGMIKRETRRFAGVPFPAMVLGADRYLNIRTEGSNAAVSSKLAEHGFEVIMKKQSGGWQVVGVKDDRLAEQIARAIGEQIIAAASGKETNNSGDGLPLSQINEMLRRADEVLR